MTLPIQRKGMLGICQSIRLSRMIIISAVLLIVACGDGAEPITGSNTGNPPSPSVSGASSFNNGLSGRVVTSYRDLPVELNLATGLHRNLPIKTIQDELAEQNLTIHGVSEYFTSNVTGTGYVQTVQDCYDTEPGADDDSCVAVYNSRFERLTVFRTPGIRISGAAKLSRSGKYIAFNEFGIGVLSRYSILRIVDVSARSIVDTYVIPIDTSARNISADESPLTWGPNDELMFSVPSDERVTIYMTNPVSWAVARTVNLPASYRGEAESLSLNLDGTKLLIGYEPEDGLGVGSVLLLDLDTLDVTVPVVDARDAATVPLRDEVSGNILSPGWSPDGQYIMVVKKSAGGSPIFDVNGDVSAIAASNELYAVPANASRTVINGDQPSRAIVIRTQDPSNGQVDTFFRGDLATDIPYFDWVQ